LLEYRLLRWRLSGKEVEGDRIWDNLRGYSGWMCAGCLAGIVTLSTRMHSLNLDYVHQAGGLSAAQLYELEAMSHRYLAASNTFLPVHLLCVIFSMNMVLRRVSDHASHSYYNTARDHVVNRPNSSTNVFDFRDYFGQYALYNLVRSMHLASMLLCTLNAVARFVAAGFFAHTAMLYDEAAAATDQKGADTRSSLDIWVNTTIPFFATRNASVTVTRVVEAVLLVFVAFGYLIFFPACIVMFRRVQRQLDSIVQEMNLRSDEGSAFLPFEFSPPAADGSHSQTQLPIVEVRAFLCDIKSSAVAQRRRFLFCLLLVLTALVVHASYALFIAIVTSNLSRNFSCGVCGSCQPVQVLIAYWVIFTPELHPYILSLCSMPPLLFSLWLMTTPQDRALLLLLNPSRFLTHAVTLQRAETVDEATRRSHRVRMGINLK
jgi:hypothetical protein